MKALWAELTLGWRRAVRGPFLVALVVVLALCLLVLPGWDDPGLTRTGFGISLAWSLLLVSALWCGGTAYALDRDRHRLTLAFTKPIRRWTLWWGRFLGTLAPFAAALLAMGLFLVFRPFPEGRTVAAPENLPDLTPQAQAWLDKLQAEGKAPEGASEERLLRATLEAVEKFPVSLNPGQSRTYVFPPIAHAGPVTFRLSGRPFLGARQAIRLAVVAACEDRTVEFRPERLRDQGFSVDLPDGFVVPGKSVSITLLREDKEEAGTVLYRERADVSLLSGGQAPTLNLAAFCLTLLVTVAMAVALGMALGCAFSLPVTLFVGALALLAVVAVALSPGTSVLDEIQSVWSRASTWISACVAWPFRDLVALDPLRCLMDGEAIGLRPFLRIVFLAALPWCVICSLAATLTSVTDEDR